MDFMPLRLNSSSLTCSICALAAIILQLVSMECQKLHMVDSPIESFDKHSILLLLPFFFYKNRLNLTEENKETRALQAAFHNATNKISKSIIHPNLDYS